MTIVSDTSPLCYLILIGCADVLPKLYGEIFTTQTVLTELCHPDAPAPVRAWSLSPPDWVKVQPDPSESDSSLASLHPGERTTIRLAEMYPSAIVLLDDSAARAMAAQRNLKISGLLGVLRDAAQAGLLDLNQAIERLRSTNFRVSPELLKSLLIRPSE
jgi:predicted nucleic acid-binding protein